jgi:Flp pilus assembly protein TadG
MKSILRSERGTSLIEFAVILPVFALLLVGLIELGRFTYFWIVAEHAARAGVQYGAQNLATASDAANNLGATDAAAMTDAQISGWTAKSSLACTLNGASAPCPANNSNAVSPNLVYYVQVQVTGTIHSLFNYPGLPHTMTVSVTQDQRVVDQ